MGVTTPSHVTALAEMQGIARRLRDARNLPRAIGAEVSFLGETNLANPSAVRNLMTMARNSYVFCGARSGLEKVLPGVRVHVLGPPTVAQTDSIRKQRSSDPDQFWQFQARAVGADEAVADDRRVPVPAVRGEAELRVSDPRALAPLPRAHDARRATAADRAHARPADEQYQRHPDVRGRQAAAAVSGRRADRELGVRARSTKFRSLLSRATLYKVGHHGSRNATPEGSVERFQEQEQEVKAPARLKSLMSTMAGKHGHVDSKTEVPRSTLVDALESETEFFTTQAFKEELYKDTRLAF